MKKMRKGFTLVELIIVMAIVAILGTTLGMQLVGSTGSAKATSIISNIDTIKGQTRVYYAKYWNNSTKTEVTTKAMLEAALPAYTKYFETTDVIKYEADETDTGATKWFITVKFNGDPESKDIAEVLGNTKLYKDAYEPTGYQGFKVGGSDGSDATKGGIFKVYLLTGEVSVDKNP